MALTAIQAKIGTGSESHPYLGDDAPSRAGATIVLLCHLRLRQHLRMRPPSLFSAVRHTAKRASLLAAFSLSGILSAGAAVTFTFNFTDAANTGFNDPNHPEYKAALIDAGQTMGSYYANTATVVMTVSSTNDPKSSTLASAGSPTISPNGNAGFFPTVVQAKVISNGANDLNGNEDDGSVNVNLGASFQYDANSPVASGKIDFKATMIHELTHAFGFLSNIDPTPATTPGLYSTFDSFLTDASGNPLINPSTFVFDPSKVSVLTGGNNTILAASSPTGEYFSGSNAKGGFNGSAVPIFSPNPYQGGSSGSHVDDNTQATHYYLMAANVEAASGMMGVTMTRTYSTAEAGIMRDLGYSIAADHPPFFNGQTTLSNGVYYLAFPNGNYFGYYSYLSNPLYIYHFDLGYEYLFDAADGKSGVYFYDFKSSDYFYTSPTFPFPYLYDFNLNTVLYYYPDPSNAGHYNTGGVRYFYNFATGQIISK